MDQRKFHQIMLEIGEVRANCDSRPGDRRTNDINHTHGLVMMAYHDTFTCEDCDQTLARPRVRDWIRRAGAWIERCEPCRKIRDPKTGLMVKPRKARQIVNGVDGSIDTWPDPQGPL